jgi:hypothetical protein
MLRVLVRLLLGGFVATTAPVALAQQGTSEIRGRVSDEQGGVLPGVAIVVTNEESGVFREVSSTADGTYFLSQMIPGRYRVSARLSGFRNFEHRGVILEIGKTLTLDLSLTVGAVEETVTVTGDTPLVDLTTAEVGGRVSSTDLTELPAPNRNFFAMVGLLPGIQFSPSADMGNDTITATGQASQGNNVTLDGGYNTDDSLGSSVGGQTRTPLESIQEFQVITNQYDAEYGRATGAIVNAVSKSGTNQFKGVGFGYFVNSDLTAKDYFAKFGNLAKPETSMKQWGGTLGGPIAVNKMHFFFSLERLDERPNRARTFPTRPEFDFSTTEVRSAWNTMIRLDHQINANNTWAIRWLRETAPQIPIIANRGSLAPTPGTFTDETDSDQTIVGTYTTVLGNTKVNTFRSSATIESWYRANTCWRDQEVGDQAACAPTLDHLSFFTQQHPQATGPKDRNYQIEDTFSWYVPDRKGNHDLKFGTRYHFTELQRNVQSNMNGTFTFSTDLPFNAANPRTYPERLTIRVGEFDLFMTSHALEAFVQDKWQVNRRLTLSLGVRYDLEVTPIDETDNPLFSDPNAYPIDRNNVAPRLGFSYGMDEAGQSVLRGGYGLFYGRTILGTVDDFFEERKYSSSFEVQFPQNNIDAGPSSGNLPTDPFLVNGPIVNRALLNSRFPAGTFQRTAGQVTFDSPDRVQPYTQQATIGYERQLGRVVSVAADYIRMAGRDMFLTRNINPMVRANTSRTGAITRVDAFGILGESYPERVWLLENAGDNEYDALNLQLEKREADGWSGRLSYSLSKSRGTASAQGDDNTYQVLTDLNLDDWRGPSPVDRRHTLTMGGRVAVPKTGGVMLGVTSRYMSGTPFTIIDTSFDPDRNGELTDPLPAGVYSGTAIDAMQNVENKGGRNGAIGPNFYQLDMKVSYRLRKLGAQRTLDITADVFNVTNRANFNNPSGDRRLTATFLRPTSLYGGSGFPRQVQIGARFAF